MKKTTVNIIPVTKTAASKDQFFTYLQPGKLKLRPGQLVQIPFGNRLIEGVVLDSKPATTSARLKKVEKIIDTEPVLSPTQIALARYLAAYYLVSMGMVIKSMLPKKFKRLPKPAEVKIAWEQPKKLTPDQARALKTVLQGKSNTTLLHGITGSGKTEVYLQAITTILESKKQALVLIPEISLTPQTIARFTARFGTNQVAIWHSRLSSGQRYQEWLRIRSGQARIVIGPRSALFAPVRNLGIIIIDEEHETTYKQWDQHPRYHARTVALKYSDLTDARLVLGSATPSLETYYQARQGNFNYARLPKRINQAPLPPVDIIDMKNELAAGNRSLLSTKLQTELEKTLQKKEQAILFLNRRGAATFVMCRDCGYVPKCPRCSVSLTYHWQSQKKLICHHCDYQTKNLTVCPQCRSKKIRYFGGGTQRVETEVRKIFPRTRILRLDSDTTRRKDAHTEIFNKFARAQADILIGTQMVAKGFDLPKVSLIGIISADTNLFFPDFRAHERTFQTLTQVAGRTSRRDRPGRVILQTYHPQNPAIRAASHHDYVSFYNLEITQRKKLDYPPFSQFVRFTWTGRNQTKTKQLAEDFIKKLESQNPNLEILGPARSLVEKKRNLYSWNLLWRVRSENWRRYLENIPNNYSLDVDPIDLLS